MGIQIKKQEDRINQLYQQTIQLINEMKRNNSRNKIGEVQKLQKEYWKEIMRRDIPEISEEKRNELLQYMAEYVPLGIQKGYFSRENILEVLESLTKGIARFRIEEGGKIYGTWSDGHILAVKPSLEPKRARHVIFHELTHCVINKFNTTRPRHQCIHIQRGETAKNKERNNSS